MLQKVSRVHGTHPLQRTQHEEQEARSASQLTIRRRVECGLHRGFLLVFLASFLFVAVTLACALLGHGVRVLEIDVLCIAQLAAKLARQLLPRPASGERVLEFITVRAQVLIAALDHLGRDEFVRVQMLRGAQLIQELQRDAF